MIDLPPVVPVTEQCVAEAAARFDLPTTVLYSILKVEGGKVGKTNKNTNGTYDMGPMQINSIWLPTFSKYLSKHEIINDGCKNVLAGAWILKANIVRVHGDFWRGVGNYHSRTKGLNERYQWKVYQASLGLR